MGNFAVSETGGSVAPTSNGDSRSQVTSRNPYSGEILGSVPDMGAEQVRQAVTRARQAQQKWAQLSVVERCQKVARLRDVVVKRARELCELITREGGKTRPEALWQEVVVIADLTTYFCKRAPQLLAPEPLSLHLVKHRSSYLHYVPRGVVGVIAPWNFPFSIPAGEAIMALIAGNGVVLKPSEITPLIAIRFKEIYDEAGLPPDLLQVVTGRGETGRALIESGIDYCMFTGSTATGRKVAAACGERLIPCTLELGGKAPAIVCADADLDRTARALVWGSFANQGQVCASVERVYAVQSVYDSLVEKVVAITEKLRLGNPSESETVDVGVMTWDKQVENVEELLRLATGQGAKIRTGGKRQGTGLQFQPTVLTDCRQDMEIMRREIFGPVMPIMRVPSEEEAILLANDSHLGLTAYVFTGDRAKGRRIADRIEAGTVMINDCLITYGMPETPWGGVKQSGIGRTHSDRGLQELCQLRHVNDSRVSLGREIWWYPYSFKIYQQTLKWMKWLFR